MSLQLPFGVKVLNPLPVEDKYLNNGFPYTGKTQVNTLLPIGIRHTGLTVNIGGIEYWYATGVTNAALVVKSPSVVSGGGVTGATNGLSKYANGKVGLGGSLTGDTTIDGSPFNLFLGGISGFNALYASANQGISLTTNNNNVGVTSLNGEIDLSSNVGSNFATLNVSATNGQFKITDGRSSGNKQGIIYAANYSADFVARSLVDKGYVTGLTSTSGVQSANNGLTKSGTNVHLGGNLTGNTTISGNSFQLNLGGTAGLSQINLKSVSASFNTTSGDIVINSGNDTNLSPGHDLLVVATHDANIYANNQVQLGASNNQITLNTSGLNISQAPSSSLVLGSTSNFSLDSGTNNITTTLNGSGTFEYAADYSANFVARSIPDKAYVDSIAAGLDPKQAVRVATTGALTGATYLATGGTTPTGSFIGAPTVVDGITLVNGNRILVKNQVDPKQNGIYSVISFGVWYRSSDLDGTPASEVAGGDYLFIETGSTLAATGWVLTGDGILTINTDPLKFVQFSAANSYIAGTGISIIGNTINNTGVITANNGLTKTGTNVHLGGALTGDTTINGASIHVLTLDNLSGFTVHSGTIQIDSPTSGDVNIGDGSSASNINISTQGYIDLSSAVLDFRLGTTDTLHSVFFLDSRTGINQSGIEYYDDYSANFNSRSLVDKGYVTGLTSTISIPITGATNGLHVVGKNIALGGVLNNNVDIDGAFPINIGSSSPVSGFNVFVTGGTITQSNTLASGTWDVSINDSSNSNSTTLNAASNLIDFSNTDGGTGYVSELFIQGSASSFKQTSGIDSSTVGVDGTSATLQHITSFSATSLQVQNGVVVINSANSGFAGATYFSDYSANYTSRSLVDKGYVESAFGASGATANNGLTKTGTDIKLGGDLTQNTIIGGSNSNSYKLSIGDIDGSNVGLAAIDLYSNGTNANIRLKNETTNGGIHLEAWNDDSGIKVSELKLKAGASNNGQIGLRVAGFKNNSDTSPTYLSLSLDQFNISGTSIFDFTMKPDTNNGAVFTDNRSSVTWFTGGTGIARGIEYAGDYSGGYTDRSLVDKQYVDNKIASSGFTLSNGNGTTANGSAVDLGGALTQHTTINGSDLYNFNITDMSGVTVSSNGANSIVVSGNTNGVNSDTWDSIAYGAGLYVAVANGSNNIQTSPDGITWTLRTGATSGTWISVAYGAGLFVAIAYASNNIQTSPDGITWTLRTGATTSTWQTISYGAGLFVAVAASSTNIQTSPDGITWTLQTGASADSWFASAYGNGMFVVIANSSNSIQTSPDGITWTLQTGALSNAWYTLAYGNGLFVSVSNSGNNIQTSPDGITWTLRTGASSDAWYALAYGNGLFVSAALGSSNIQTSPDGINWTLHGGLFSANFDSLVSHNGRFVGVAISSTDILIVDYVITFKGIQYGADYSANYSLRSLVDKGYVDGLVSGGSFTLTNGNGTTANGSAVNLGGSLTGDTTIIAPNNTLNIISTGLINSINIISQDVSNTSGTSLSTAYNETTLSTFSPFGDTAVDMTANRLTLLLSDNTYTSRIDFNSDTSLIKVSGNNPAFSGLQYNADYSANYVNRSLVDKGYVTGLTSTPNVTIRSITGNTTLLSTDYLILVDTSTSGLTVNLIASPVNGKVVKIKDKSNNAVVHNITINGNGHNIDGSSTALINTNYGLVELTYSSTETMWFVTG